MKRRAHIRMMRLAAALAVGIIAASVIYWAAFRSQDQVVWEESAELLTVRSGVYELAIRKTDGSIAYLSGPGGEELTIGNRANNLWWAFLEDEASYEARKAEGFNYEWNNESKELLLRYPGQLQVDVTVKFTGDSRIRMKAEVVNGTSGTVKTFRFPYELKVQSADVMDGLLPMLPGAKLRSAFFSEDNSYEGQYPGVMFAPYIGLQTSSGTLSMYDLHSEHAAMVDVGFKNQVDDRGTTGIVHNYKTWMEPGASWSSPEIVLEVGLGNGYKSSIESYRTLNGMDDYRPLADKLGQSIGDRLKQPLLKLDISAIPGATWKGLMDIADRLNDPSLLHLVAFQQGGHDENYPDFLPASPRWGTEADMAEFIAYAKARGNAVVPYTNFSWWGVHAPTLRSLSDGMTLADIAVVNTKGAVQQEEYGPHSGYVMHIGHPFVLKRIEDEHSKLLAAGMDGIFEDQWGIRNAPYVHNRTLQEGTNPSNAYIEGVRSYFNYAGSRFPLYTEDGFDVLAADAAGFMGSTYLWDLLGYRPNTAPYTDYYPMIGMLARDKVMLFQHDLAGETMTDDRDMLRWNAALGYNLSADLFNGPDHPWVSLVGLFQREVLSHYGMERIEDFTAPAPSVTKTIFGQKAVVTANWDPDKSYALDEAFTLAPGGFEIALADGKVRAGVFTRYNGAELDPGEHILAEVRGDEEIRLYQPLGDDTTIRVAKPKSWKHAAAAYHEANGNKIADIPVKAEGGMLTFDYIRDADGRKTAYVSLVPSKTVSSVTEAPFEKKRVSVNLAKNAKLFASSMTSDAFPAEKAIDGDLFSYWESVAKQFPQSLTVDLGEVRRVGTIVLRLPPQSAWSKREQRIRVSGSQDGTRFEELAASQSLMFDPASDNMAEVELSADVRFIQLQFGGNTEWPAAQLSEIEVYE